MASTTEVSNGIISGKTHQDAFDAVASAKRKDIWFATGGLIVMAIAMTLLLTLIGDLIYRGALRALSYDFMTSYPSRLPERAGILSAWVGPLYVMLVTALLGIPVGVGAGIYLEEYAKRAGFRTSLKSTCQTLPVCLRSFTACWRLACSFMGST